MISISAWPIFTKLSAYGRHLIVDCQSDPLFQQLKGHIAMVATNFMVIIGKIGSFTFIRSPGIPKRIAMSPF